MTWRSPDLSDLALSLECEQLVGDQAGLGAPWLDKPLEQGHHHRGQVLDGMVCVRFGDAIVPGRRPASPGRVRAGLSGRYTSPYSEDVRAKVVLYVAQELAKDVIAARLDTPRQVVSKWRKRFFDHRLPGLMDLPRRGRPPDFLLDVVAAGKALAHRAPAS